MRPEGQMSRQATDSRQPISRLASDGLSDNTGGVLVGVDWWEKLAGE